MTKPGDIWYLTDSPTAGLTILNIPEAELKQWNKQRHWKDEYKNNKIAKHLILIAAEVSKTLVS